MAMSYDTINTFLESTCVVVVFAYLLTRGPILALLEKRGSLRPTLLLGLFFGMAGLVELFFVKNRFPYDTYTLIVTYAALRGGGAVGLLTSVLVALGAPLFLQSEVLGRTMISLLASLIFGLLARHLVARLAAGAHTSSPVRLMTAAGIGAVALAEAASIAGRLVLNGPDAPPFSLPLAVLKVAANGFGLALLQMILNDALAQRISERYRVEIERGRAMVAEARLGALRARIHPHFLFNALTSIAGLCRIAPDRAERATVQLAQIMRRALEGGANRRAQPLGEEMEYVSDYLELERLRMGARLDAVWDVAPELEALPVPPFVLQTLVENAVQHGLSPKLEPGTVRITARVSRRGGAAGGGFALIAIADDGVGMSPEQRRRLLRADATDRPHGMAIASEQICLMYGDRARLRVFSRVDRGTLVAFRIPLTISLLSASRAAAPPRRAESETGHLAVGTDAVGAGATLP